MEMGFSSSFPLSGVPCSAPPDSLNGLTFGHKIYFENVGVGAPNKSSGGAAAAGSGRGPSSPAKKVKGVVQGPQPPRCQVEGCKVDLSDAKAYYSRHKVCGMHSKSPKVTVAGLEQRFCQQCSRFHQLPEFDQGKRSCRRRLAGHNERRRKPPPGSLFSSRYGKFTPSLFGNCSSGGGILVNFSAYAGPPGRNPWQTARSSDTAGKYLTRSWQSGSENDRLNSNLLVQGSSAGTGYPGIPSGECFSGVVSDSDCALSLLSNRQWASRNQAPSLRVNNSMHNEAAAVVQSTTVSEGVGVNHFPSTSCSVSSCSDDMLANRGLRQVPQTVENTEFTCSVVRPYMELEHCSVYDSTQQMHWLL